MCGRYQFSADEYKEIRQIVRDAQRRSEGNELNFPMAGDICPSQVAPEFQQWGLPGFRGRQQIINARAETGTEKPMFRRSIAFQRCVIPATGFYEWDAAKHKYKNKLQHSIAFAKNYKPALFCSGSQTLFSQKLNGLVHVAVSLSQRLFAVHHTAVCHLSQLFYVLCCKCHDTSLPFC